MNKYTKKTNAEGTHAPPQGPASRRPSPRQHCRRPDGAGEPRSWRRESPRNGRDASLADQEGPHCTLDKPPSKSGAGMPAEGQGLGLCRVSFSFATSPSVIPPCPLPPTTCC